MFRLILFSTIFLFSCQNEKENNNISDLNIGKFDKHSSIRINKIWIKDEIFKIDQYCDRQGWEMLNTESGISDKIIFSALTDFKAIDGRFQFIGTQKGVHFYNDNNSTTPDSTIISLQSLQKKYPDSNIILIGGGADKNFHYEKLSRYITRNISFSILFSGTATDKIKSYFGPRFGRVIETMSMKTAVNIAIEKAEENDIIILSPGSASFGVFNNEYDRNDQYLKYIKSGTK